MKKGLLNAKAKKALTSRLAVLLAFVSIGLLVNGQTTNTWKGGTSGTWSNTANWSRGSVPGNTDVVTFDGSNINGSNGAGSISITGVPTTTIGRLVLVNSANVSLQPVAATAVLLSVGNATAHSNGVDDISVASGNTLTLATNSDGLTTTNLTLGLANVTGVTSNIAGTLTILPNATTTAASVSATAWSSGQTYVQNAYVTNNNFLYKISTAGSGGSTAPTGNFNQTPTGAAGAFNYIGTLNNFGGNSTSYSISTTNAYSIQYGATTFSGTLNFGGALSNVSTGGTISFTSTATIVLFNNSQSFPQNSANITYTNVNAQINNYVSTTGSYVINYLPNSVGTLTINDGSITGGSLVIISIFQKASSYINSTSQTATINNLTVQAGIVGIGRNATGSTNNISTLSVGSGGINVSGGTLAVAYGQAASASSTITVNGAISLTGGTLNYFNGVATSQTATMTANSFTQSAGTLNLNTIPSGTASTGTLNILGDFSCTGGTITQTAQNANNIANLVMKGTSGNQAFTTGGTISKINIQINNTSTAPNNTVTLGSSFTMAGTCTLQLTAGVLTMGNYNLQIANITSAIVGSTASGGATLGLSAAYGTGNYIDASGTGVFKMSGVPATATTFPLGATFSSTKYYLPLVFTSVANSPTISVGCATAFANSVSDATKVVKAQWSIQSSAASGTPTVTFQFAGTTSDILGSAYVTSGSVLGIYANSAYSETAATVTNTSGTYTTPVSLTLPTAAASLYGVGNTGAFSTAASITLASISKYSNDADFTLSPTSANTLGAYSFSSGTTSVATVNSSTGLVHIVGPGTTTITVNQAANGSYAAGTTTAVITVIGVYTWNGTTSDYQITTNWTPTRTSSANSDVLQFNANATVTNVKSDIIGRLVLSNNAQVSLQETSGTSATLTVGNPTTHAMASGDEISVPSGCTLTLAQNASNGSEIFTLQLISSVSGVTSGIYGTLTIAQNTATTYANVYNAVNGVTTVYGTGVVNYAGSFNSSTASSLVYKNGATINNQRADATFSGACSTTTSDRVNVSFSGINCGTSGTGQIPINNLPAYIGTLTVNATGATGTMNVRGISGGSGTAQTADITTLTVSSTGTGSFGFGQNTTGVSTVNVGAGGIAVTGGKLNLAYNIGQTITVNGDLTISNSSTVSLCSSGSNTTYTGSLTVNNFTQTGTSTFKLNANGGSATLQTNFPTSILTVKGNFSVASTSTFFNQISSPPNSIVMNGSAPQTITASGTFTNVDAMQLEINNTATSTVSLSSSMPTIGTLKLTKGQLVLGNNNLTTAAISGGSSTTYVNASGTGRLTLLAVPTSATTFPIGTASSYAPVTFTGGTAGADISTGVKSTFTHSPSVVNNVVNLEWAMVVGNSISTTPTVKFQYNASTDQASGYSSTGAILGTYEAGSYTESTSAFTIDATTPTATTATIAFTNDLPTSTEDYYGIGNPNSFAVSGLPSKPTIGTASISGSSVSVSFTPPADAVATGVTGYLVTSSPGGITATGTTSPISISGLGGGTSYTFTVKSVNAYGNSPASTASNSVTTPVYTYTWTGATNSNYQTATNWSPNRTTPTTTDKIQFSNSATVTNVPTQTIGRLVLSGNASVSLQPTSGTSATLSVGNTTVHINGVDDINVPIGCTLTMAANASGGTEFLTLQLSSGVTGVTANIAGTLTIAQNTSSTYANTYNAANGVTTISGTVNYVGGFSNISSTSLLFTSNSTFNNQRGDAAFPPAFSGTYTRVNVSITGAVSTVQVPVSNFPVSVNTLTINAAGITGSGVLLIRSISGSTGTSQVADITNLTVTNGIVGFGTNATAIATVNVGSGGINVSGGKLLLAYNNAQTITVAGGINLSGTGVISMCSAGGSAFAATLTTTNFTQTGSSTFYVNGYFGSAPLPTATMNVTGNFSIGSGSLFSQATGVTGTLVFNSTNAAQTISSAGTISTISTVQINNTTASPNNTITLGSAFTIPKALTLTSGTIAMGSNTLTVGGTLTNNTTISGTGIVNLNSGTIQSITGTGGTISNLTTSNSGTAVTISGTQNVTGILKVSTGTTLNTGGLLTLKSTSINNSAIVDQVDGSISGTVTVERYIPKGFRAYRDIAPEVYGAGTIFKNWQLNGATTPGYGIFITGPTSYAGSSNAGTTDANGFDASGTTSNNTQDYTYVNGTWTALSNTNSTSLDPFTGYRLLIRGDRTSNLYTTPVINTEAGLTMFNATTLRATGQLVTGTVTYNTIASGGVVNTATGGNAAVGLSATPSGFSLIANPYVCPVSWTTVYNSSKTAGANINATWYSLNPTYGATGSYDAYNALSGAANTYSGKASDLIQAGQAFFVQNAASSPVSKVVFTEAAKVASSTKTSVFGAAQLSKIYVSLMKQSTTTKTFDKVDGAAVAFRGDFCNKAYGPQDAVKFSRASDNLAISDKGNNLSIDGRLPATASDAISLAITKPSAAAYQLSVDASNYVNEGLEPLLYDAFKNTTKALGTGTTTINFTVDANNAASFQNRFTILFTPSALPVNSIAASASLINKIATISWKTVGEKNVVRYEVEKSADAKLFTTIGQSAAKNTATASYTTTDNSVTATTYYRIKAVSTTGAVSYSNVAKVQLTINSNQYTVYPNPLKGKTLNVELGNVVAGKYTVSIYNGLGQKVSEQAISHTGGSATHAISINNALAAGAYSLTISEANSKQLVHQLTLSVQP